MQYQDYKMAEKLKDMMWKFPCESKEYRLAQSAFGFLCERIREKDKIKVVIPFEERDIEEVLSE